MNVFFKFELYYLYMSLNCNTMVVELCLVLLQNSFMMEVPANSRTLHIV